MRINTQGSAFVFNLPSDLIPEHIIKRYEPILEKNWIPYENVIDYINSTIKEISLPGLSIPLPKQILHYGKERNWKPAQNLNDVVTSREISIVMARVDSDLNYFLFRDIIMRAYLDVEKPYIQPFQLISLDIHRDAIYNINFTEIILNNISEIVFAYNQQTFDEQTFTVTFNYNFMDMEFILNGDKVMELSDDEMPIIKERDWNFGKRG